MIITLASQKGGTGKTTTAAAIWAACSQSLAIDLDVQGNLSLITGASLEHEHDAYDVLTGECSVSDAVQSFPIGDVLASSEALTGISDINADVLKLALEPVAQNYKHVVIDTPPCLNILTINALVAADILVVPVQADVLSLQGLRQIKKMIDGVREINPTLRVGGILVTRYNSRSIIRRGMMEAIKEFATNNEIPVFGTTIRDSVAVVEAQTMREPLFDYAPKKRVTADYRAFINELEGMINNG